MKSHLLLVAMVVASCMARVAVGQADAHEKRPATIDDLLKFVHAPVPVVPPAGDRIAIVVPRSGLENAPVAAGTEGDAKADIAIYSPALHATHAITNSRQSGTTYGSLKWSPDGTCLAFVEIDGDALEQLMLWDTRSDSVRPMGPPGVMWFDWVSDSTLISIVEPVDSEPVYGNQLTSQKAERLAARGWATQRAGTVPSVSVLDAGPDVPLSRLTASVLWANARAGVVRVMAPLTFGSGLFGAIVDAAISPDGSTLALLAAADSPTPSVADRFDESYVWPVKLGFVQLDRPATVRWVQWDSTGQHNLLYDEYALPRSSRIARDRLVWAPDASEVAVLGYGMRDDGVMLVPRVGSPDRVTLGGLTIRDIAWPSGRSPLALAGTSGGRVDWYAFGQKPRNLTGSGSVSTAWIQDGTHLSWVADGALWSLSGETGTVRALTDSALHATSASLVNTVPLHSTATRTYVLSTASRGTFAVRTAGERGVSSIQPLRVPGGVEADASHVWVELSGTVAFALIGTRGGSATLLAWDTGGRRYDTIATVDAHLDELAGARHIVIPYRGTDGDSLLAKLTLPVGYVPGHRYPMITLVYPGQRPANPADTSEDKLNLWAAHGYLVLEPAMPQTGPMNLPGNTWFDVARGVVPAVNRVVELGYAAPDRVGVWGHSDGGFAVYALLGQTQCFRAAVAEAGPSDQVSSYGEFTPMERYTPSGAPFTTGAESGLAEHGPSRLGSPPSINPWVYWQNSPTTYLARYTTPLLIVQGDMDYVPITQGEEVFTGLQRLGKRVEFARYWGEGHVFDSPANIRDKWQRELAWFDQYLR